MRTTRRTFFAALTSSVAALVAIAKGKSPPPRKPSPNRADAMLGRHGIQVEAGDAVKRGDVVYFGMNGRVSPCPMDHFPPIGVAMNDAQPKELVTLYFD